MSDENPKPLEQKAEKPASVQETVEQTAQPRAEYTKNYFKRTGKSLEQFVQDVKEAFPEIAINPNDPKSLTLGMFNLQQKLGFPLVINKEGCDGMGGPYTYEKFMERKEISHTKASIDSFKKDLVLPATATPAATPKGLPETLFPQGKPAISGKVVDTPPVLISDTQIFGNGFDDAQEKIDKKEKPGTATELFIKEQFKLTDQEYRVFMKISEKGIEIFDAIKSDPKKIENLVLILNIKGEERIKLFFQHIFHLSDNEVEVLYGMVDKLGKSRVDGILTDTLPKDTVNSFPGTPKEIGKMIGDPEKFINMVNDLVPVEAYKNIHDIMNGDVVTVLKKQLEDGKITTMAAFTTEFNESFQEKVLGISFDRTKATPIELPLMIQGIIYWVKFEQNGSITLRGNNKNLAEKIATPGSKLAESLIQEKAKTKKLVEEGFAEITTMLKEPTFNNGITINENEALQFSPEAYAQINEHMKKKLESVDVSNLDYMAEWQPITIQGKQYQFAFNIFPGGFRYLEYKKAA